MANNASSQAIAWLKSMAAGDPDSFDTINAENCLELIRKQRRSLAALASKVNWLEKRRYILKELNNFYDISHKDDNNSVMQQESFL